MIFGPTYEEMLHPEKIDTAIRKRALRQIRENELDPVNLFNITWKDKNNQPYYIILPPDVTGIECNVIVLLGYRFPSGSHKVGPAYSILMEGQLDGTMDPEIHTILGPSTGNFGIGVSYIANLMGFHTIVIMPDNMSAERYERIKRYGAQLELTPGTESDVILSLERTSAMMNDPKNRVLAQFESFGNYRFHRYVTGYSCVDAVQGVGNGRCAAFVSAPGSAGTLAAGDTLKKVYPECKIVALEPKECSTLIHGGCGQHRIEGIGDKMCTLIHNVGNTDFVAAVHDYDCIRGLDYIRRVYPNLHGLFGISSMCNILGAIKTAKHLHLSADDNIVTIATDGLDRYHSVLKEFTSRTNQKIPAQNEKTIMDSADDISIYDFRSKAMKEQLFAQKERDWIPFGYTKEFLDSMREQVFWDTEYEKCKEYDAKIQLLREYELQH